MKLVVDAETDRVLGASMCGPDAPEIIQVCFPPPFLFSFMDGSSDKRILCMLNRVSSFLVIFQVNYYMLSISCLIC